MKAWKSIINMPAHSDKRITMALGNMGGTPEASADDIRLSNYVQRLKNGLADLAECPICTETMEDSRCLPCTHAFCLKCLQDYGKNKKSGEEVSCPVCRETFMLGPRSFEALPSNHFINKLIDLQNLTPADEDGKLGQIRICGICLELEVKEEATGFCLECQEYLCVNCSNRHRVVKATKRHKILSLDNKSNLDEFMKQSVNYCYQHPDDEIKLYCHDCKITACLVCYVDRHKEHQCADIKRASVELSGNTDQQAGILIKCLAEVEDRIKLVEQTVKDFGKEAQKTVESITRRHEELKALLNQQYQSLLDDLREKRVRREKELQTLNEESEHELLMIKSFDRYWSEVKARGSACDVVQAASDLDRRMKEIIALHEKEKFDRDWRCASGYYRIIFNQPAVQATGYMQEIYGKLEEHINLSESSLKVSQTVKDEMRTKTTYQKTAKGFLAIAECSAEGVIVDNSGRRVLYQESLAGWKIKRVIDGVAKAEFVFPEKAVLKSGEKIKIWVKGSKPADSAAADIEFGENTWGVGHHIVTTLINPAGEDRATHTQKTNYA